MNSTVAVIGAGITGLTAAYRLRQAGVPVTVYEAGDRIGGVIQSLHRDGFLAEFGPNTILETSPMIVALVKSLGLEDRRLYSDPRAENRYLVRYQRPIAMPGSALGFFGSRLFSLSAKAHLFREPFVPRSDPAQEESVAEFVIRRLGREFLDYAINPMVGGIYAGDPARLSVKHAFPKLGALEQKYGSLIKGQILGARERKRRAEVSKQNAPKFSFRNGLQELIDALGTSLGNDLQLRAKVKGLKIDQGRWHVSLEGSESGQPAVHSAVLLAIPAYAIAQLELGGGNGEVDLGPLADVVYPPVTSVVLGFRRDEVEHPLDGFGVLIPQVEGFRILGTLFSSSLFPGRAPEGMVTLTSYVGGMRDPDLAQRDLDEIIHITCEDLKRLLGVRGKPCFQHAVFYPKAIPQYEVGYGRFKDLMDRAENRMPGLYLAGHFRNGISLGDSMVAGHEVADRIGSFVSARAGDGLGNQ